MPEHAPKIAAKQSAENTLRGMWQSGNRTSVEAFLEQHPELASHEQDVLDLIYAEFLLRERLGETPKPQEYRRRFPSYAQELDRLFEVHYAVGVAQTQEVAGTQGVAQTQDLTSSAPPASATNKATRVDPPKTTRASDSRSKFPIVAIGDSIGRYQVLDILGEGGFGIVYKALDPELQREVAIKVPHPRRNMDVAAYLSEAQSVARLDHPGVVPVYDVGRTSTGQCYVVSKYISGGGLDQQMAKARATTTDAVKLVATVAEALHHAHGRGLVHRDIKPANILMDEHGQPLLADFGLALKEEDFGQGSQRSGTPAYMSPEQARGAGHTVDGRSDIYSLGVVLYELLTGRRPYRSRSASELLNEVAEVESRPPRQLDDTIPEELDRICIKALAKRPADRYSTAIDLCRDLRNWLAQSQQQGKNPAPALAVSPQAQRTPAERIGLAMSLVAVVIGLGCLAAVGKSWMSGSATSATSDPHGGATPGPASPANAAVTSGVDIQVHVQRSAERGSFHVLSPDEGPLHDNDRVQLHIRADRPRYCYVYWCDPHSGPQRLWPKDLAAQKPVSELSIPPGRDQWLPLQGGPGNEMIVAAATDRPLRQPDLRDFERRDPLAQATDLVARPVTFPVEGGGHSPGTERGIGTAVTSIKIPLSESFEETLRTKFDVYRGLIFPHE